MEVVDFILAPILMNSSLSRGTLLDIEGPARTRGLGCLGFAIEDSTRVGPRGVDDRVGVRVGVGAGAAEGNSDEMIVTMSLAASETFPRQGIGASLSWPRELMLQLMGPPRIGPCRASLLPPFSTSTSRSQLSSDQLTSAYPKILLCLQKAE